MDFRPVQSLFKTFYSEPDELLQSKKVSVPGVCGGVWCEHPVHQVHHQPDAARHGDAGHIQRAERHHLGWDSDDVKLALPRLFQ